MGCIPAGEGEEGTHPKAAADEACFFFMYVLLFKLVSPGSLVEPSSRMGAHGDGVLVLQVVCQVPPSLCLEPTAMDIASATIP